MFTSSLHVCGRDQRYCTTSPAKSSISGAGVFRSCQRISTNLRDRRNRTEVRTRCYKQFTSSRVPRECLHYAASDIRGSRNNDAQQHFFTTREARKCGDLPQQNVRSARRGRLKTRVTMGVLTCVALGNCYMNPRFVAVSCDSGRYYSHAGPPTSAKTNGPEGGMPIENSIPSGLASDC